MGTLFAFYAPGRKQFTVRRFEAGVVLENDSSNRTTTDQLREMYVPNVFQPRRPVVLAITSGILGTSVYADGVLLKNARNFHISGSDMSGRLQVGTSPFHDDGWSGDLGGLAFYRRALTAPEVYRTFRTWVTIGGQNLASDDSILALYVFDEQGGRVVHDLGASKLDLSIPVRFALLHEKFLELPWDEFRMGWSYWKNIAINIVGFLPLGVVFCTYLTMARWTRHPTLVTVILGASVSLTIEVLQAFLPTRDSGTTDLITNTLGTALGAGLFRWKATHIREVLDRLLLAMRAGRAGQRVGS